MGLLNFDIIKCEVCEKNDYETSVLYNERDGYSSRLCSICRDLNVDEYGLKENMDGYTTYNHNDDRYYDKSDNHLQIKLKNGKTFDKRSDFIEYQNGNEIIKG